MSKKLITAIKQLNKVQYLPNGSEIKVPLLKEQIDIESLKDKDNDELEDIFFEAIDSIPESLKEFIPKKLSILHSVIYEKRSLSELSRGGAGTGFVPDQHENCPECGKYIVIFKKKPPFDNYFCPHVLLVVTPLFDGNKFSYIHKSMAEIADKLVKNNSEEYKGLGKHMEEYANHSEGKYDVIKIINYNSRHQETCYYLIEITGKKVLDSDVRPPDEYDISNWDFNVQEEYWDKAIRRKMFDMDFSHRERGKLFSISKDHQQAIYHYSQAIRVKPNADVYNYRGFSYSNTSQFQLAIEDYNEAIRLKPDFSDAYANRGDTYYKLGQYESAIKDYDEAIRLKPDNDKAFNNRGFVYKKLGQYDRAIEDYNEAIRVKPGNDIYDFMNRFSIEDFYFNKACCLAIQKKAEESCNALKMAVSKGYADWRNFNENNDFDNIVSESCFISLIEEFLQESYLPYRKEIKEILKNAKKKIQKERKIKQ